VFRQAEYFSPIPFIWSLNFYDLLLSCLIHWIISRDVRHIKYIRMFVIVFHGPVSQAQQFRMHFVDTSMFSRRHIYSRETLYAYYLFSKKLERNYLVNTRVTIYHYYAVIFS